MIVFLGVLGLLAWLAEKYSMDHVLDGLDFATALDKTVVEPGEDFSWTMTINNRKHLMVPYLQMREQIPAGLVFSENGENVLFLIYSYNFLFQNIKNLLFYI